MADVEIPFNKKLRNATREVHSISDALVNGKLAFALSADAVWAQGLLVFYEIFRFLEQAMERHKQGNLGKMVVEGMLRTEAFEKDLAYYLGADWKKNYSIRPAVAKYLSHLQSIEQCNPDLLIAYIYHLYVGLLSGGQILKRKRSILNKFNFNKSSIVEGEHVTDFGRNNIYVMKKNIIKNLNEIACNLDNNTKDMILEESKQVFLMNNEIIQTIEGTKEIIMKKILIFVLIIIILILLITYL